MIRKAKPRKKQQLYKKDIEDAPSRGRNKNPKQKYAHPRFWLEEDDDDTNDLKHFYLSIPRGKA